MNRLQQMKLTCICVTWLVIVHSCGDIFAKRTKIVGNYYLFEEEGVTAYSIRYKLATGDFIGRVPAPVVEYGWTDSIFVAKSKRDSVTEFYIIDRKKDHELAEESDFLIEISNEARFDSSWRNKLRIDFTTVE